MNRREIVGIVRQEFAQILLGQVASTTDQYRASATRFEQETPFEDARLIQPYGLASRPSKGVESLVVPLNGDPTHLVLVGQNDAGRPATQEGESCLYGADGQVVYLKSGGKVLIGSQAAAEPAVLGNVAKTFLTAFIDAFLDASEIGEGIAGPVYLAPEIRTQLTEFKETYLTDPDTNILAQKIFVERGAS